MSLLLSETFITLQYLENYSISMFQHGSESLISQNLKMLRDHEHISCGDNLSRMHYYSSVSMSTRNLKCLASPIAKKYDWGPKI